MSLSRSARFEQLSADSVAQPESADEDIEVSSRKLQGACCSACEAVFECLVPCSG